MIRFRYFSKDYAKEQTSGQPEKETVHFTFSKPVFLDSSAPLLSLHLHLQASRSNRNFSVFFSCNLHTIRFS